MEKSCQAISEIINGLEQIFQTLNQFAKNAEKLTELTGTQRLVLKILANDSPMRVSDLARTLNLHPSTTTGILDRLEKKELTVRTRSAEDRRSVYVNLTPLGEQIAANSPEVTRIMLVRKLEHLPQEQLTSIVEGMSLMSGILRTETGTQQP